MDCETEIEVKKQVNQVELAILAAIPTGIFIPAIIIALAELQYDMARLRLLYEDDNPGQLPCPFCGREDDAARE